MSDQARINVVAISHNIRSTLLNGHVNWDKPFGLALCRRAIYDVATVGRDIHGPQAIAQVLYRQADLLVRGDDSPPDLDVLIAQSDAIPAGKASAEDAAADARSKRRDWVRTLGGKEAWFWPIVIAAFFMGVIVGFGS